MENIVLKTLMTERQKLLDEKQSAIAKLDKMIYEFDTAIEYISGSKVGDIKPSDLVYDDEHPDYIKGSQEEM